ncbi:terminase large subunit domain-containing protein [Alienimonas sp. DA493]|uniref:terminase large subunit domain-containing protein n=1 Tax=Alienimonas sp. DA493 TaxID=3373605 RepID=UPI0037552BE8
MGDLRAAVAAGCAMADRDSSQSLSRFLSWACIDCRPNPAPFGDVREPWQAADLRPYIPAIEAACGLRPPIDGPRRFWRTRPRGHFKTGEIALLMCWLLKYAPRPVHCISAAADKDQARLVRDMMERLCELNPWFGDALTINRYDARGPGGTLEILSSDVGSSSGLLADVIVFDELTWWPRRDLFDVLLSGMIKLPQSVLLAITNAGVRGSWQHEVLKLAQSSPMWDVRETPVGVRPASWQSDEEVAADRAMMTRGTAMRVYDNRWTDESDAPLMPSDLTAAVSVPPSACLWPDPFRPPSGPRNLLVGIDIGLTHDATAAWCLERVAPRTYVTRALVVMQGVPLAEQERRLVELLTAWDRRLSAGKVDMGSVGRQLADALAAKFRRMETVSCSSAWQGRSAAAVQLAATERRLTVPGLETGGADPVLVADFGAVNQTGELPDGSPRVETARGEHGHADRFWGLALAIDADAKPAAPPARGARLGPRRNTGSR